MANVEHSTRTDPNLHEPKGASTAVINTTYVSDGAGSGVWELVNGNNVVHVNSTADLPAAAANVITLAASTTYIVSGTVDLGADVFVMSNNTALFGIDQNKDGFTTTSTSALITATNVDFRCVQLFLNVASGDLMLLNGTGVESVDFIRVSSTCDTTGSADNLANLDIFRSSFNATTAGLTFTGAFGTLEVQGGSHTIGTSAAIAFDLGTATFDIVQFAGIEFQNATGAYGIDVAAAGANINTGGEGYIFDCYFLSTATATNYVAGDTKWTVVGSIGVPPSQAVASAYVTGNATATTFGGTGVGNDVVAAFGTAFVAGSFQRRFTTANTHLTTYNGIRDVLVRVSFNISASIAGGAARTYNFYVAKDGVLQADSITQRTFDGTNKGALTCSAIMQLSTSEVVSLRIRAETATTSLTIDTASVTIVALSQ